MSIEKYREIRKVLWLILAANITVAAAKIIMGSLISSASMTADGYHSLTDGSSNIIGLIGIGYAAKPVDEDHPYGHKKFETLTSLVIVAGLVFMAIRIVIEAYSKFSSPLSPRITVESLIVMVITLIINIFVTKYEYRKGIELDSPILVSDSFHTKSDIYVTIGVIISLAAVKLGAPPVVDPLASLAVAGFILHAAYEIFMSASVVLVDRSVIDSKYVESIALSHEGVRGVHKIRSRGTAGDMHIDMHILAERTLTLEDSHKLVHEIEDNLRKELKCNLQVIIHLEPDNELTEYLAETE